MSIASAITAAQGRVADCYTAISNKGGTLPATQNLANMPTAIGSISTINATTASVTPTTSAQTITPTSPYNAFNEVSVSAVTSSIDNNITAGNIKSGVSILGVNGSLTPLNGTTLSVTPTTSSQSLTPSSPYNGYTSVSVSAVTASIDANITAGNIKSGVSILGVTGSYTGSSKFGMTLDNFIGDVSSGTLAEPSSINGITFTGVTGLDVMALQGAFSYKQSKLTGSISFPDLVGLDKDSSLKHSFSYSNITSVDLQNLETVTGSSCCNNAFLGCIYITFINLSKLKTISGSSCCSAMFNGCNNNSFTSISLPLLETISGLNAASNMFNATTKVTSISLPKLKTISGASAAQNMFYNCGNSASITTVDISALETINGNSACNNMFSYARRIPSITFTSLSTIDGTSACNSMFHACADMASISFPALTTTSFGSSYINQFNDMFNSSTASTSGTCTVHFPSNLEPTIQGLTGYPTFGGNASRIVLAFDLPSTS